MLVRSQVGLASHAELLLPPRRDALAVSRAGHHRGLGGRDRAGALPHEHGAARQARRLSLGLHSASVGVSRNCLRVQTQPGRDPGAGAPAACACTRGRGASAAASRGAWTRFVEHGCVHLRSWWHSWWCSSATASRGAWCCKGFILGRIPMSTFALLPHLCCLLQLSARVLAGVEHRAARRSSSTWTIGGHVSWSMDTSVEHGGVRLGS